MNCRKTQNFLSAYLDGELHVKQAQSVEQHLAACAECSSRLAQYRRLDEAFIAVSQRAAPADFLLQVHQRIERSLERSKARRPVATTNTIWDALFRPFYLKLPLEVAAAAAVVVVCYLAFQPAQRSATVSLAHNYRQTFVELPSVPSLQTGINVQWTQASVAKTDEIPVQMAFETLGQLTEKEKLYIDLLTGRKQLAQIRLGLPETGSIRMVANSAANISPPTLDGGAALMNQAILMITPEDSERLRVARTVDTVPTLAYPAIAVTDTNVAAQETANEKFLHEILKREQSRNEMHGTRYGVGKFSVRVENDKTIIATDNIARSRQLAQRIVKSLGGQVISQGPTSVPSENSITLLVQVPTARLAEFRQRIDQPVAAYAMKEDGWDFQPHYPPQNQFFTADGGFAVHLPQDLVPSALSTVDIKIGATAKSESASPLQVEPARASRSMRPLITAVNADCVTLQIEIRYEP